MLGSVLARSRAVALCAALGAVVAGCTAAASSTVTAPGTSLTIYVSVPPGAAADQRVQDVLDAEQLALKHTGAQVGGFTITVRMLEGSKLSDNARTAIQDSHAIAYLGEVIPGDSADSIGITNALQLPEVSPTDTAQALTESTPAVSGSPKVYYEDYSTYGQTFARLVPTTVKEAAALVQEMQTLGVRTLYLTDDGSDYGKALALSVRQAAGSITVQSTPSGADAVLDASAGEAAAAKVFNAAAASSPSVKLLGPSALDDPAFVSLLSPVAQHDLYISAPGFMPSQLTPEGQSFVSAFKAAYQHDPEPDAIFGYAAMSAVLTALREAGSGANNRAKVLHELLTLDESTSVLGPYRLDASGDTSVASFVISRVKGGSLVPIASVG
jgi:branched-chain amino acid transport system substrate-binding protein